MCSVNPGGRSVFPAERTREKFGDLFFSFFPLQPFEIPRNRQRNIWRFQAFPWRLQAFPWSLQAFPWKRKKRFGGVPAIPIPRRPRG
jgi:hypothetical protein